MYLSMILDIRVKLEERVTNKENKEKKESSRRSRTPRTPAESSRAPSRAGLAERECSGARAASSRALFLLSTYPLLSV